METLKLALDWTPNINHIGFFIARELGYYEQKELIVELLSPAEDDYQTTPAKKVELGLADLALCPTESLISYQTKQKPLELKAIAAVFQEDVSGIACLKSEGISSPKQLDGKLYASYQARYEDGIVKQMMKNDGGAGQLHIEYPNKLGIWNTLLERKADATWIFLNWEGIQAEEEGIELEIFKMKDYNIPYSYSPVIAGEATRLMEGSEVYRKFLAATKEGYLFAKNDPIAASKVLAPYLPEHDRNINLVRAQEYSAAHYGPDEAWGEISESEVERFLGWIYEHKLESKQLTAKDLIFKL